MLMILLYIVCVEVIILLGILIVYWLDYTYSYIDCHCRTEPCPEATTYEKFKSMFGWIKPKDILDTHKGFSVTDNGDTYHVVLSVAKESDGCDELEQFKNLADDYNIPFDSFYDVIEKLLTEE